jgi:hypothetical protein
VTLAGYSLAEDPTSRGVSREALIAHTLSVARDLLGHARISAHVRELRAQARSYEQAVERWASVRPTPAQLGAMFDLVRELHDKAVAVLLSGDGGQ